MSLTMPMPTDLAMELLCLLSPRPTRIDDLADDLGLASNAQVLALAERLKCAGYAVEVGDIRGIVHFHGAKRKMLEAVWISLPGWLAARQAAQQWWDKTRQEVLHDDRAVG